MWQTKLTIDSPMRQFDYTDKFLSIGSCFADEIGQLLQHRFFDIQVNPTGVLYNPLSILKTIQLIADPSSWNVNEVFEHQGKWRHFDFHSRLSAEDKPIFITQVRDVLATARAQLEDCSAVICTLGTSFTWRLKDGAIVGNCHKLPGQLFNRNLLSSAETLTALHTLYNTVQKINPSCLVLLTVSPIRHIRDGLVANNLSKARLIDACHTLAAAHDMVYYFPAYEIVMDELRDYRYYDADMIHLTRAATDYIYERFYETYFNKIPQSLTDLISKLNKNIAHKPREPNSPMYEKWLKKSEELIRQVKKQYHIEIPYSDG